MATSTVLITGCSTGFGKLAAKTFHKKGWNVAATMRSPEKESDLIADNRLTITRMDVTDLASIEAATESAIANFGGIDVLVNNAGYGSNALFEQSSDESIRSMYETNVFGVMNTMRVVLPHMRARGSGRVINVTSMAGLIGLPGNSVYCSSKYAVEGLTEGMAHEYGPLGIQIKTVAPGAFPTTAFLDNVDSRITGGEDQLQAYSVKLREHFSSVALAGEPQDPLLVADKIFECATEDTPVCSPVGFDAEGLMALINGLDSRQAFVDAMAARVLPADLVS
ncbi:MAG: SDR family oxidoreductase [Pseudomonadota bacterium]